MTGGTPCAARLLLQHPHDPLCRSPITAIRQAYQRDFPIEHISDGFEDCWSVIAHHPVGPLQAPIGRSVL